MSRIEAIKIYNEAKERRIKCVPVAIDRRHYQVEIEGRRFMGYYGALMELWDLEYTKEGVAL